MNKPNSKRNLDMAIRRLGRDDEDYLENRSLLAHAIIGQMIDVNPKMKCEVDPVFRTLHTK